MNLYGTDVPEKDVSLSDVLTSLVPTNIFAALANGDALKALVFALLFGLAVGRVPERISIGLSQSLETVYHACQKLMHWLSYPLPLILFCMSAAQLGKSGVGPLHAMLQFVMAFFVASRAAARAGRRHHLEALQPQPRHDARRVARAVRAGAGHAQQRGLHAEHDRKPGRRARLRALAGRAAGAADDLAAAGRADGLLRLRDAFHRAAVRPSARRRSRSCTVLLASVLAGFASAGMTGLVTVSLVGMTCVYLGLPFEAAFILFLAVDPVCDMLRTLILVIGNTAAVTVICPRPLKI